MVALRDRHHHYARLAEHHRLVARQRHRLAPQAGFVRSRQERGRCAAGTRSRAHRAVAGHARNRPCKRRHAGQRQWSGSLGPGHRIHGRHADAAGDAARRRCARLERAAESAGNHRRTSKLAPPLAAHCGCHARRRCSFAPPADHQPDPLISKDILMPIPRATARLQLHKDFTFDDAAQVVPYYAALGISHIYASPILTARSGSTHGYDIVDPTRINAELGGEEGLRRMVAAIRAANMGLILDIVPNHMGVGPENPWWQHVLEWGQKSPYARWFDIDWEPADETLHGKVMAPFLGQPYGDVLAAGEIKLQFDEQRGKLYVAYFAHRFPVAPADYAYILRAANSERLA